MATVRIHRLSARVTSQAEARRLVRQVCREIEFRAKVTTAVGPYTTGRLARSIFSETFDVPDGAMGRVGSWFLYAASVQSGAKRHRIVPHRPPMFLKFYWRKVGRVVYLEKVNHPGQPGKHYLTDSLKEVARRHRMRYVVHEV